VPERELEGRVSLVTGASRGIGRAIAIELGRAGARVAVNYAASADAAEDVVAAIRGGGGDAVLLCG
jgi:3-oxoacyl-[acyl-carrier protein] reductase